MREWLLNKFATDPTLIPAIHNYCDRRCERCRLRDRCSVYRMESFSAAPAGPGEQTDVADAHAAAATVIRSLRHAVGMLRRLSETCGLPEPTEDEIEESDRMWKAIEDRTLADPHVGSAKEYFTTTMPIVRALRPHVLSRGDDALIEAVETIEALAPTIASKVYRAVSQRHEDENDANDLQSDANGSAKIARILVAQSITAWKVLMELGRATANGVPAQLVRRLEALDAGVARLFPRAMEFIRPGFDEVECLPSDVREVVSTAGGSNA